VDDCGSWQEVSGQQGMGCSAYAVKYFPPYLYHIRNYQGIMNIIYGLYGFGLTTLMQHVGFFYRDFYANSPDDFKLILVEGNFVHYLNGTIALSQSFTDFKLVKLHFPIDTIGFFIAKLPSATTNNLIVKYTPTTGFNIVYQNPDISFTAIDFTNDNIGFVTGSSGTILRTDDLGDTWTLLNTGVNTLLNSIDFVEGSTLYAAGIVGVVLKTEDLGNTWIHQSCTGYSLNKIAFVSKEVGFAYSGRVIFKTTNGGFTWIPKIMEENMPIISPNPNFGLFTIQIPELFNYQDNVSIMISDCTGKVVFRKPINSATDNIPIDICWVSPGLYFIRINSDMKSCNSKFVIE